MSLWKINKIDKTLDWSRKQEDANKIINEREGIKINITEIQRIKTDYYEQLYINKLSSLEKNVLGVHWKDWCWSWNSNTLATWNEELTHWKRPWCWERLRTGGKGDNREWDGWMASPTRWTWVRVDSRSWWWTGRPGMLQCMGS